MMNTTASELFERLHEVAQEHAVPTAAANRQLHEILVLACHAGVQPTGQAFGNLFSQVDFLCKRHRVSVADKMAIQTMRRHSNRMEPLTPEEFMLDVRALSLFIAAVFGTSVPDPLLRLLPAQAQRQKRPTAHIDVRYVRCIVQRWTDDRISVSTERDAGAEVLSVDYGDFSYLRTLLTEGMQLNLLDCSLSDGVLKPALVVVEPDFLVDISSVAACFQEYGHHPLLYTVNRMKPRANTQPILLGNFAGAALDEAVADPHFDVNATIRKNFREKALEYTTCSGFDARKFLDDARQQATHVGQAVDTLFADDYQREKAVLEPSFVCEQLGLQGRVDLMTTDMRLLVEQKAGRNMNIERGVPNAFGSFQLEPHYVQLLLYYGVLRQNFHLGFDKVDIRLLYSKYEAGRGLVVVAYYQKLFREAIALRNQIVATELYIARHGFESIIDHITPETLNTHHLNSTFFQRYLLPQLQDVTRPLQQMSALERLYYCRMMTFVYREQRAARLGAQEGVGNCSADLWNMPLSEKRETGNIFTGLRVEKEEQEGGEQAAECLVRLSVPDQGDAFLPNFRRGDRVYLYAYDETPDVRQSLLYKATLTEIGTKSLTVSLMNRWNEEQRKENEGKTFAIEHDSMDVSTSSAVRGLHEFITAPQHRRDLLLAQREPACDRNLQLSRSYHPNYDEVLLRAKRARDYFLLVGPPGTGKTSMALQFLVREELQEPSSAILLMAYTNRAVDEICSMLMDCGIGFLRIGNEYSCDKRFRPYLLEQAVGAQPRLDAIRQHLTAVRVVVATTASLATKPFIFALKRFSLAIVDEASQILEPSLIGILASHALPRAENPLNIGRFILVGDHKQLPAVVQQTEADARVDEPALRAIQLSDCRQSLFERLIRTERAAGRTDFMGILHRQGRMHPGVARFTNTLFYEREQLQPVPLKHQLEDHIYQCSGQSHVAVDALQGLLLSSRQLFIPSAFCRRGDLSDKVNPEEAKIAAKLLVLIKQLSGSAFDAAKTVGIIVPYRNQIAMIRHELSSLLPDDEASAFDDVSIDTVERYQGSQRDVIIYCFTVQHRYQLDFLAANTFVDDDGTLIDRKLNVALTRARKQNIIIGNRQILSYNPLFRRLVEE